MPPAIELIAFIVVINNRGIILLDKLFGVFNNIVNNSFFAHRLRERELFFRVLRACQRLAIKFFFIFFL